MHSQLHPNISLKRGYPVSFNAQFVYTHSYVQNQTRPKTANHSRGIFDYANPPFMLTKTSCQKTHRTAISAPARTLSPIFREILRISITHEDLFVCCVFFINGTFLDTAPYINNGKEPNGTACIHFLFFFRKISNQSTS